MKSTTGWEDDGNGTNTSGFAGLSGGCRIYHGEFSNIAANGYWWSSSEFNGVIGPSGGSYALYRGLSNSDGDVVRGSYNMQNGLSVRCIRD